MIVVHNSENTLIEHTPPKTTFKASYGLKNHPDPILMILRLAKV